ncbi:MAG: XdhC/CoxI family protein [Gemmatimonadota bacterium]|nr:XdhC/CoxI family protein [Gemmatimonadota bacterium]
MRDLLDDYAALAATGQPIGRAVVTSVWGSAPRPEGACMLATPGGRLAGSVSGGCVEGVLATEIAEAIGRGTPRLVTFGVSDERAWEVGLSCGGTIKVFVEPSVRPEILAVAQGEGGMVVATVIQSGSSEVSVGDSAVIHEAGASDRGSRWLDDAVHTAALTALARESCTSVEAAANGAPFTVFLEVFPRRPTVVIFGAVQIAAALVTFAKALGYRTVVADGRAAFLTRERFPDADELILAWPAEAFDRIGLGPATYVCLLSHDPKFDDPAMELALRSPARYIGAIGSKKTQAARRERLRALGFSDTDLARLHGPIGLPLGGRAPAETALAIIAEMTQVRYRAGAASPAGPHA